MSRRIEWRKTNAHGREGLFVDGESTGCVIPCWPERWQPVLYDGPHLPYCDDLGAAKAAVLAALDDAEQEAFCRTVGNVSLAAAGLEPRL